MYSASSRQRLSSKIEYEQWMLNDLHDTFVPDHPRSGDDPPDRPNLVLKPNGETHGYSKAIPIGIGRSAINNIVNSLQPLIFTASYKHMDMFFEWLLEEHKNQGVISEVPRHYGEKVNMISCHLDNDNIEIPAPLMSEQGIFDRMFTFYADLRDHRNAVIHRDNFELLSGGFRIVDSDGVEYKFTTDELFALLNAITTSVRSVIQGRFDNNQDRIIKLKMNEVCFIHDEPDYSVTAPWSPRIQLPMSETQNNRSEWIVDVTKARELASAFPDSQGYYLYIPVFDNGDVLSLWDIPKSALEGIDSVTVGSDSDEWAKYRYRSPDIDIID